MYYVFSLDDNDSTMRAFDTLDEALDYFGSGAISAERVIAKGLDVTISVIDPETDETVSTTRMSPVKNPERTQPRFRDEQIEDEYDFSRQNFGAGDPYERPDSPLNFGQPE